MKKYRIIYSETLSVDVVGVLKIDWGGINSNGQTIIYSDDEVDRAILAVVPKDCLVFAIYDNQ